MSLMRLLWVISAAALAACVAPVVDEGSPYYRLPAGATVVLKQDLVVPAGQSRVFLQYGKVVEKHRLKSYEPSCNFEQRSVSDGTAVIRADRFKVTAVSSGEDYVVQRDGLLPAGWQMGGESDGITMVNLYLRHELYSPSQPQVLRLTCHGGFEVPGRALLPSLIDIRAALGGVATIELP